MRSKRSEATAWAIEQFGGAQLGDSRRVDRLVRVAAGACEKPSGKVSDVFAVSRELDGAYDFLENDHVLACRIALSMSEATARLCTGKSSGGPPGSITIARGLERLRHAVEGVEAMAATYSAEK